MKDEKKDEKKDKLYNEKENTLGNEICDAINSDSALKHFFTIATSKILVDFTIAGSRAHKENDVKAGTEALQKALAAFKAITTHVCIKVITKRKAKP